MILIDKINHSAVTSKNGPAVLYANGDCWSSISYGKINLLSKQLQEQLELRTDKRWTYILLYLKISKSFPLLILGVLKANLGFVCVEEEQTNLLNYYVSELKIKFILSNADSSILRETLKINPIHIVEFDLLGEKINLWDTQIEPLITEEKYIYAIKTSGTTGASKLVQVSHDSIYPNIRDLSEILQIGCHDVIPLLTPVTFDPSVIELFLALYNGCSVCIVDRSVKDPQEIADMLFSKNGANVTLFQTTPSLFKRWNVSILREKLFYADTSLRAVILGGEEFPSVDELSSWCVPSHICLYNIYGITEVSCWASINKIWPSKNLSVDIGNPLSETVFEISSINDGGEGELLIGSSSRKCLVGNESVEEIFKSGQMIFRNSGDIFKKIDGKLYFIGRKDDILKRWGTRVSLSDIEKVAQSYENTVHCSCVAVKMKNHYKIGLFIVENSISNTKNFQKFLKKHLPSLSWPDFIKTLPSMPLTNHGKICKDTLKNICLETGVSDLRTRFNELWELYTSQDVTSEIDFLSAGGDSFTALQFFYELKTEFCDIPDTFVGLLLQNKSQGEVWKILEESYEEYINVKEEPNQDVTSEPAKSRPPFITNILKVYSKGKTLVFSSEFDPTFETRRTESQTLELIEKWKFNLGKCVDATPIGVSLNDKKQFIIIGSHSGQVVVLDINSQSCISESILPNRIESSACISMCGSYYYLGCYDGCMYCISTESGKVIWKYQTDDTIKSTAAIFNGCIVFGSYDRFMYCLQDDGLLKWKTKLVSPILSEAVVDGNIVFSATLGSVAAIDGNTGHLLWELIHCPIFSTPVISSDQLIIADVQGKVKWLNKSTGEVEHIFGAEDMIFSSLVKAPNSEEIIIFGCSDCSVYCLKNKKLLWKTALDSKVVATPFIENSDFYTPNIIVCFSSSGSAYLLNFFNGKIICHYSLPGEVFSSPILLEKNVIVGCRDDNVYILQIRNN